ncbi:hypothetical protein V8C35DRAFT_291331 [Trichoderma chlorosporum]
MIMETILEDEVEGDVPADPEFPPFFYVEDAKQPGVYVRSYKITDDVFPPYLEVIPADVRPILAESIPTMHYNGSFPPLFFYSASKPLPSEFVLPFKDRPPSFYICLTHDNSIVNIVDPSPKVRCGPAAQRVLRSPELLESIFVKLDVVTILTSIQRVNKFFKQVVDGSLALQRKLYFKSDPKAETGRHPQAKYIDDDRTEFPKLNSLLVSRFGSCFFNFGGVYGWQRRAESFYENRWTRHHHRLKKVGMASNHQKVYTPQGPQLKGVDVLQASADRERFTRAGASWRKMLVCQPPVFDFGAMIFEPVNPPESLPQKMEKAIIKAEDYENGLCMGQLYDFVQERAGNHPLDSLWFRLTWFDAHGPFVSELCSDTVLEWVTDGVPCVVEMYHKSDSFFPYHPPDPPQPNLFNSIFRCKDFKPHKWVPEEIAIDYRSRGYDPLSPVSDAYREMIWCGFSSA